MADGRAFFAFSAAALLLAANCAAAVIPDSVGITARADRTTATVGDPIRYEISVTLPAGAAATLPAVRGNTGRLEVAEHAERTDTAADGRVTLVHTLTLLPYHVGADTLPPQRVEIRTPPDTAATVLMTPPTIVTITPVAANDTGDIADIRDDDRLPRGFPWGLFPLAVLVAAVVWGIRRLRRRPRPQPPAPPPAAAPAPDPGERAFARLQDLERRPRDAREFAFELSEILREYLAARYGIDALEATTAELTERLAPLSLPDGAHDWMRSTGEALDAMKFAGAPCALRDALRYVADARALVRDTAPARPGVDGAPPDGGTTR